MPTERSATEELQTLGALLRLPLESLLEYVYVELANAGFAEIRPAHGAVFRNVSREGSRITALASRAGVTKQSMAELVEYLRARGYVELRQDPTDGRAKLVRLSARGWKVHDTLVRLSQKFEQECARDMGDAKWRQFRSLLTELAACTRRRGIAAQVGSGG